MFLLSTMRLIMLLLPTLGQSALPASPTDAAGAATAAAYAPVHSFDPARDGAADVSAAIAEAHRTGKRVLMDVGGNWCGYCDQMERLFHDHPDLVELRDAGFITVAVYVGPGGKNQPLLARYPKLEGIPHLFVLDGDGAVLHSQHATELRSNGGYDARKVEEFLRRWSPSGAR